MSKELSALKYAKEFHDENWGKETCDNSCILLQHLADKILKAMEETKEECANIADIFPAARPILGSNIAYKIRQLKILR